MAFFRLLLVTATVSVLGGLFGASVGGLLGYAVPSSLSMFFGTENRGQIEKKETIESSKTGEPINRRIELGVDTQRNMAGQGMAVGGAFGLVFGAALGALLGIVDQVLHVVRGLIAARKEHPAGKV